MPLRGIGTFISHAASLSKRLVMNKFGTPPISKSSNIPVTIHEPKKCVKCKLVIPIGQCVRRVGNRKAKYYHNNCSLID
jgi:hypothetical protein